MDLISWIYYVSYGLLVCIIWCGNLYGGGDLNFNWIIFDIIRLVFWEKLVIICSDGSYVWDYFYIKDGVLVYLYLVEEMEKKEIWGEVFNFSNEL